MSNLETPCDKISHMYALPDDTIVIDDNDFVDEDSNSTLLFELAKQLDLEELYGGDLNNGAVADFTVDLNDLDAAAKDFHSSIIDDQPSLEVVPPRKSPSNDVMPSLEVVPPRKSPSRPLRLEDHVENFFKSYAEYDTLRSSKMTKESHEKALSDAQRCLDGAKLAHEKLDGSMDKLQATLADVEKDLKALTFKKRRSPRSLTNIKRSCPKVKRMSPLRRVRFIPLRHIM
ncbi:hypothetical protein KY290_032938 [Solanum tuberosum]|uniref:Uncharacterized protein n=1 Tax=Solanum tuberosum TaxID=4113 RepID=A0ABQ7UDK2_SOLTU|nr:hypothetical protein KY284_031509 [Solanum tuberosum]KAH0654220.1 hypothetical protein KY289_031898 [Solanum tuberosum]KAH0656844.1 hypothetical protein KY285_031726 [Solanum tuberosum]KAH0744945.1 hypothetical protein KY290_032938 [Solanum tuberosum]